ncbi:Pectin lyase-like superfamily protein [Zea mays]|uniref:Pectin lyase-like superfamily protein n=1 Tax=Zea mays TaxID=4577 RepID=A0A1D6LRL9_MAIZE|nr:Pectin lyase-like superfamily protein [Zea mays]
MACTDNVMRALFLLALFCVMHGEKEESKRIDAKASGPGGSFDITKLGASGNGKIDNTKAVQEAWASACGDTGKQTILIPKGDFLVGQLNFTGPCKGDVTYGSGHGISIGSLGRYKDEKDDTNINVKDCTLKKTTFGVRIKAYEDAASVLTVSKIHYENIKMEDSANPIFIDMKYCPNKLCTANDASKVTVKDVTFKNITGTSSTPEAVSLLCSAKIPCTGVTMDDINVEYSGTNNKTMAICTNAKGSTKGCLKELACF